MTNRTYGNGLFITFTTMAVLGAAAVGCGDEDAAATPTLGNPLGAALPITHAEVAQSAQANLELHINGLDTSLTFLEGSDSIQDMMEMIAGEDEEREPMEIDLSDLRDTLVDIMVREMMLEDTATLAADGRSITYDLDPSRLCNEDEGEIDPEESSEARSERLAEEESCRTRIADGNPKIWVMSDAPGDLNLQFLVGSDETVALSLQLHDDLIAGVVSLPSLRAALQMLTSPEDLELPEAMEGELGFEIRRRNPLLYSARFAILEDIDIASASGREPFHAHIPQAHDAVQIDIDGNAAQIEGSLTMGTLDLHLPWQMIVDIFYDEEERTETICEPNPDTGADECREEPVESPEAPEVSGAFIVNLPAIRGALEYTAAADDFRFAGLSLGDTTTTIRVDDAEIIRFDLNPEDGREFGLVLRTTAAGDIEFAFAPTLDARLQFAWNLVADAFTEVELPDTLLNDTLGVRFDGAEQPTLRVMQNAEDGTQLQMAAGQLTLSSVHMAEDVLIEGGQCIVGTDDSMLTDAERESRHALFGGLTGGTCSN